MCRDTNKKEIKMANKDCRGGGFYVWVGDGGCCVAAIVLISVLALGGCGISKGVKALSYKDNKPKTEQVVKQKIKPQNNVIAYNNVKTY